MVSKGVLINNFLASQLNYSIFKAFNKASENNDYYPCIFFENPTPHISKMMCPIMPVSDAYLWEDILVATTLSTADKLISFPSCKEKIFYVWDLEWIRIQNKQYSILKDIYRSSKLKLVARSDYHKKIIEECWNVKIDRVSENFQNLIDSL